jgi:hypothetical protein
MAKSLIVGEATSAVASGGFLYTPGFQHSSTEINTEYAITHDCTFSNLRRFISAGGAGANVLTVRKNNVDTQLSATGTGTGAGTPDLTDSVDFVAGDILSVRHTDDNTDPQYRNTTMNVEFDGQTGTYFRASSDATFDLASVTRFIPLVGSLQADGTATEANVQIKNRGYSKLDAFQVRVSTNARTTDTVFVFRVNGSDVVASTITVGAGLTGLFVSTEINQALADGDLLNGAIVYGTGTEALVLNFVGTTLLSASDATEVWAGPLSTGGQTRAASATPHYYLCGGVISDRTATTSVDVFPGYAADCTGLRIHISANTYAADATLKLFVNGVDSGFTTTITAGATGWLENTVDTETITASDVFCFEIVGGTSGSITMNALGMTLEQPSVVNPSVDTKPRLSGGGIGPGGRRRVHPAPLFSIIEHD